MVDYTGLAILVIGGYVLIKYGPQIAQNLQQQQAAAAPQTAPAATDTTPGPAAPAPTPAQQLFPPITINMPAATPTPAQQTFIPFLQQPTTGSAAQPTASQQLFSPVTFPAGTKATCVSNTQDAACGDKGHPKCCPGQTLLGSPLQMVAGSGPAVSTRAPKATPPPRTSGPAAPKGGTLNPQCEGNPCGVTIPGKCLQSTTGTMVTCTQSSKVAYANVGQASSYLTQVVNGKPRTTIDPFFPAGFYLSQADYRSSLKEPALH